MIYHRPCTGCGSEVKAKNAGGIVYCEWCKEIKRLERRERRILNARRQEEYRIVEDAIPVEHGGFPPGARITEKELTNGLRAEYRSFSVGTIIEDKSGDRFLILNQSCSNGLRLQKIGTGK